MYRDWQKSFSFLLSITEQRQAEIHAAWEKEFSQSLYMFPDFYESSDERKAGH